MKGHCIQVIAANLRHVTSVIGLTVLSIACYAGDPMRPPADVVPPTQKSVPQTLKTTPEFTLTHIVYSGERKIAYINGTAYKIGQTINGASITGMTKETVVLERKGKQIFLRLTNLK